MSSADTEGLDRLQKVMAAAGVGSRRASEELIAARRVTVNGKVAKLGDKADPVNDVIHVDGQRIVTDSRLVYLAMNKPRGVVSTMADDKGREAVADYLGNLTTRVYHVGRLDADSEGLLLLTNDGGLAHKLMHPSYEVPKTYLVELVGPLPRAVGRDLLAGVQLSDGPARLDAFKLVQAIDKLALVEVTLHEGRNRIVRRMFDAVGFPVQRLVRTAIGPIKLGDLRAGRHRRLNAGETAALFKLVDRKRGASAAAAGDDDGTGDEGYED
ncbi:pseudouridine synthase [Catellatospora tritici]|uniref:pseudouridine synthase n=1 Tax=Catellatospora tritici TaxID=2851566 RepID=UPI001C2DEED6|nr:pseudouridine synthase [Catellatospora tritici]MBV1855524.1 rRNA pseudouridine synthase [Catellatospora tritici]